MNPDTIIEQILSIKVTKGRENLDKHLVTVEQLQRALTIAYNMGYAGNSCKIYIDDGN